MEVVDFNQPHNEIGAPSKDNITNIKSDAPKKRTSAFLYFVALIVNLNWISFGITIIWISPVASKLLSFNPEENPLGRPVTIVELSLIGSLSQIGMVIGPLLLEKLFDKFGRKRCINVFNILIVISLVALAFSTHIILYFIIIFTIGILFGGANVGVCMYLGEITEDHNRAKMTCLMGLFTPIGNLIGYILGPFYSVRIFTLLSALPSLILVILSELLLPESPTYLLIKGKKDEAKVALTKLLGNDSSGAEEVAKKTEFALSQTTKSNRANIAIIWSNKATRKGFITACVLLSLTAATGVPPLMSYLETVFTESGTEISGSTSAIVTGGVQVVCFLAASVLVEKWGRRPLLLISSIASTIPLSMLGLYFYLLDNNTPIIKELEWVPITSVILLMVTAVIGICSVAVAYMNEVFTSNIKATAISLVYFISGIIVAISILLFPLMMETIGLAYTFWIFSVFCLLGFIFIYIEIPETKDKNILEIQQILSK